MIKQSIVGSRIGTICPYFGVRVASVSCLITKRRIHHDTNYLSHQEHVYGLSTSTTNRLSLEVCVKGARL